ncbi:MAG: hypothetical protein H7Z41_01505 [Cytophagales bacterium]|nr:hypothetical protein [Armatimonadota bacterium]
MTHEPITEMSGIVKSRRYPNVYWVHNDSGDEPRLFALRSDGTVILPPYLSGEFSVGAVPVAGKKPYPGVQIAAAANSDWEDIALDGDTLYIADTGNNGNARRDLGLYVVAEPNPEATFQTRPLKWLPIAYPDQTEFPGTDRWEFDCEALFIHNGKPYFVTKHRAPGKINTAAVSANLYRLDTSHTDRVNLLTKVDGAADLGGWVTSAKLSPNGRTLAVLCQGPTASIWLFETPRSGDRFLSSSARRRIITGAKQCEALCFDTDDTLVVTNEQRDLFRLSVRDFAPVARGGMR